MYFAAGKTKMIEVDGFFEESHIPISWHETLREAEAALDIIVANESSDNTIEEFFIGRKRWVAETIDDYEVRIMATRPKVET